MKVGIISGGNVGQALAKGFVAEGHEVYLATREPEGDKGQQLKGEFPQATVCSFATAAKQGELIVLCVPGGAAQDAVALAGADNLAGKVVIDTMNALDRNGDVLQYAFDKTSLAEKVQGWLPESKVVKAFNTVGADLMYRPQLSATPTMFLAGDDMAAKEQVSDIVTAFGWEALDNGPLSAARELEAMVAVWIRNSMANGRDHAFKML